MATTWQPKWMSDPVPRPRSVFYEWLDEGTGETLFEVEVTAGGLIHVLEDDWLSKYTKAIYGDFGVDARFLRINPAEKSFNIIKNVDLIYTGETLLHVDSFLVFEAWLKDNLTDAGTIPDDILEEMFDDIQSQFVNWTTGAVALDLIGWILEFVTVHPAVTLFVTFSSLVVGLVSNLSDIIDVHNPEKTAEQFYSILYTTTAWIYDETSEITTYPTTDEDLGEFNQYIPQLPYSVPGGVANPKSWFYIHGYGDSYRLGTMSKDLILIKLDLIKNAWQDTATDTIDNLLRFYREAHSFRFGDPTLTLEQYKKGLRTVMLPGKNPLLLGKAEFFKLLKKQVYETFRENWWGPTAHVQLIMRLEYTSLYPVPT
jgi:hypothetical protein